MQKDGILSEFDSASQLDLWILWLKVMATGITATLLILLAVFALSLRQHGQHEARAAYHFTLASLFATMYIGADATVRMGVAVGDINDILVPYRLSLSTIVLSIAAYTNLYWALDPDRDLRPGMVVTLYGCTAFFAALVWVSHPALIIASDAVTMMGTAVFADYGAGAPVFFGLCLLLFAAVCLNLIRLAYRVGGTMVRRLTVLGFTALLAASVHDVLRELGVFSSPAGMLPLGYACFQVGAFAVLAIHYSRTLQDRQHQGLQLRRLTDAAARDAHSGLFTRAYLENSLNDLAADARGGLLFLDLDHFKAINDRFGHLCGDQIIRAVSDRIRINMRDGDIPCRWGGDEFVVYLPGTDSEDVVTLTDRLNQAFGEIKLEHAGAINISVSMGFAELSDGDWRKTLERADKGLYNAKHAGRNQLNFGSHRTSNGPPVPNRA